MHKEYLNLSDTMQMTNIQCRHKEMFHIPHFLVAVEEELSLALVHK